jgi:hypothetical protein
LYQYAKVLNKWDVIRTHWDSVTQYGTVFEAGTDWNRQAPCGTTFLHDWSSSPDFLMAHMQGHLALARMAREVGDELTYRRSVYQFSRTLLTYVVSWNIQKWAFDHRPHFTPRGSAAPEQGYTYASAVRGDGVIQNFLNSSSPINPAAYWPFTRSCPDLAVFWDLYLRETIGKYLYHDLAVISPYCIDLHSLLARAYLFESDPQTIRRWIDHGAMHVGDWGSGNHFALFMTVLCQPPVRIKPPDPHWINQDYEARIAGADRACDLRSFEDVSDSEEKMKSFRPIWTIGRRDNSGREFSQEELSAASMMQQIAKLRPEAQGLQRRGILLKEPDLLRHIVEKTDGEVYTIGKSTAADWRYIQPSAWSVMGGALSYEGRHHPRALSFAMPGPLGAEDYCFAVALCRLDSHFPLFMTIELNGHATAVRCPLPSYAARDTDDKAQGSSAEARAMLAFRVPAAWLKIGENRATIHVEGTSRVFYDWLGFGKFLRSDTPLE